METLNAQQVLKIETHDMIVIRTFLASYNDNEVKVPLNLGSIELNKLKTKYDENIFRPSYRLNCSVPYIAAELSVLYHKHSKYTLEN